MIIVRIIIIAVILTSFMAMAKRSAHSQPVFNYPDNYRHSREMILDPDHGKTARDADSDVCRFFFDDGYKFKEMANPRTIPQDHKKEFKDKMDFWHIMLDRLQPKNIFNFTPLTSQLSTGQRLVSAVSMGVLFDQDRKIYTDMDRDMRNSRFWSTQGKNFTLFGDGMAEAGLSSLLYVIGGKKNREVSQMLMESALSLRIPYIKRIIGFTRPSDDWSSIGLSMKHDALPSGHTAIAFSMATILGESYNIKWLTYPLAIMAGLSRIQQNTHWPSDVFSGAVLGLTEAREILARHNYIPTDKFAESSFWDNTRVDIESGLRSFSDSYVNMERNKPASGQVGRLTWRWRIDQRLSRGALLQVNYHWVGQTPRAADYNAVEDVLVNPRIALKMGRNLAFVGEYSYKKIQFDDLGRSPHSNRGVIPADLRYSRWFVEHDSTAGFIWSLSPSFFVKPSYTISRNICQGFPGLNSRGNNARLDASLSLGPKKCTTFVASIERSRENTNDSLYSLDRDSFSLSVDQKLFKNTSLRLNYLGQNNRYPGWPGNPSSQWKVLGAEVSQRFAPTWQLDAGYFRRHLSSSIPGWPYSKDQYYLDATTNF
jgi:hypothetical protein